jgi:hypothetical protein
MVLQVGVATGRIDYIWLLGGLPLGMRRGSCLTGRQSVY